LEKVRLVKYIREYESKIIELSKEEKNIDAFFDLISEHNQIIDLQRKDISSLIDKVLIHEKKNKLKKRIVEVYFVHIGAM
jgi:F0F1-type ATP synthase delta subunit